MKGSVYRKRRPNGSWSRWYAVIDLPKGPDGRRRQQTSTHATKADASAWLAQRVLELRAGEVYDTKVTVGEFLRSWLAGKQAVKETTRVSYAGHIEQHLVPRIGHLRLQDVRAHHLEEAYRGILAQRAERPVGPNGLRRIHATVMSAFNTAVRRGLIRRNPGASVEFPRPVVAERQAWTAEQAGRFLRVITDDPWCLLYRLLLVAGLRRGEALGLRWGDIDWEKATVSIRRQLTVAGGRVVESTPKSRHGTRTVAVDAVTLAGLRALRRAHPTGIHSGGDEWVFTTDAGDAVHPAAVSRHFTVLVRRAGLPMIRLHDLRHTSATLGLAAGESLVAVSRRLGHSSITITADVYAHPSGEQAAAAVHRLAADLA